MTDLALTSGNDAKTGALVAGRDVIARDFFNMLREVVKRSGAWHAESDLRNALDVITAYEKTVITPGMYRSLIDETDDAPVEDVRLRRSTITAIPVAAPPGARIDYEMLARAIVAAQAAQQAAETATDITSMPPVVTG